MSLKRARSPSPASHEERLSPCPIYKMGNYNEIHTFLCSKVKEQTSGMYKTVEKLLQIRDGRISMFGASNVYSLLYTGPSGCGKTETLRWIRFALGMDLGYEYQHQYIEICNDFERGDARSVEPDIDLLIDRLNTTINSYDRRAKPRFILVSLDDLNNLPVDFITRLNRFFMNGCLYGSTPGKPAFLLPKETTLVIVSTCTFGQEFISKMLQRRDIDAVTHVRQEMCDSGISWAAANNIGDIIVIYPLKTETLRSILMERLEQYVNESSICKQFGEISCGQDVKDMLIDKVMILTEPGRGGIRQGLAKLLDNIGDFFGKALRELLNNESMMEKAKNSLVFTLREIDMKRFDRAIEEECKEFLREIMHSLMHDQRYGSSFENNNNQRNKQDNVNALSMYAQDSHVASYELLSNLSEAKQSNNLFNQCGFNFSPTRVARLEEENLELKDALDKVDTLVKKSDDKTIFYKKVKGIVTESKKILYRHAELTNGDDDPFISMSHSRVQEIHEGDYDEHSRFLSITSAPSHSTSAVASVSESSGSYSSEEEDDPEEPITIHMIRREKYRNYLPKKHTPVLLDSDIDEDSEEDNIRVINYHIQKQSLLKKRLMKPYKNKLFKCQGVCGLELPARVFAPKLYKGKTTNIHFEKKCNACKKIK